MECAVCCNVAPVTHKCRCDFTICRECARRFACESAPGCPACQLAWNMSEKCRLLGVTFFSTTFRASRQEKLYLHESQYFEATLPLVERERTRRRLRHRLREVQDGLRSNDHTLLGEYRDITRQLWALQSAPPAQPKSAVVRCANCAALVDQRTGACAHCGDATCLRCGERTDGAHVCNPEVLASVEAIQRDARPCPRCGAPSVRTEGCPVMWCACCHVFWHWDSRQIIAGRVPHNPDHRAWISSGGTMQREMGDVPCGGVPEGEVLHQALLRTVAHTQSLAVMEVLTATEAVLRGQVLRYRNTETEDYETMRIRHLIGDLSRKRYAQMLERSERIQEYRRDVGAVLAAYVLASTDVLQRFAYSDAPHVLGELRKMRDLTNEAFHGVSAIHKRRAPHLDDHWRWVLPYARG
jgi:hypothetical protein